MNKELQICEGCIHLVLADTTEVIFLAEGGEGSGLEGGRVEKVDEF